MTDKHLLRRAIASAARALRKAFRTAPREPPLAARSEVERLRSILSDWPTVPRAATEDMMEKYGPPHEMTSTRLTWLENGPWKRTVLYREEVPHHFPKPHVDCLEQVIDYRVPLEACDDLVAFDGSLLVDRTRGELSARCDMEAMNFLTLNLAHEIVTGRRTVEQAREQYAETAAAHMMQRGSPYTERLLFERPRGRTNDLDEIFIIEPALR